MSSARAGTRRIALPGDAFPRDPPPPPPASYCGCAGPFKDRARRGLHLHHLHSSKTGIFGTLYLLPSVVCVFVVKAKPKGASFWSWLSISTIADQVGLTKQQPAISGFPILTPFGGVSRTLQNQPSPH